jgi:hypothetical protein
MNCTPTIFLNSVTISQASSLGFLLLFLYTFLSIGDKDKYEWDASRMI